MQPVAFAFLNMFYKGFLSFFSSPRNAQKNKVGIKKYQTLLLMMLSQPNT